MSGECAICLEGFAGRPSHAIQCGHVFHVDCIMRWFRNGHPTCPTCRDAPDDASSNDDLDSDFDIEDLTEKEIHQLVAPRLRSARRKDSSRRLKTLAARYQAARTKRTGAMKNVRMHYRHAVGPFPQLRRKAQRLVKQADAARQRLCSTACALLEA